MRGCPFNCWDLRIYLGFGSWDLGFPRQRLPGIWDFRARGAVLPKSPLPGCHYPGAQEQIGRGVGDDARHQASRSVGDEIVKRAR